MVRVNRSQIFLTLYYLDLIFLTNEQKYFCEIELGEKESCNALKSMPNNKKTGKNGLSKDFYEAF